MAVSAEQQEWITKQQLRLGPEWSMHVLVERVEASGVTTSRYVDAPKPHMVYRHNLRRGARWWDLEAARRYDNGIVDYGLVSWQMSHLYAFNQRWLLELLDNGVRVIGRRFDDIVRGVTGLSFDAYMKAAAARVREAHGDHR